MKVSFRNTKIHSIKDSALSRVTGRLVVWWYGPVTKNRQADSVPNVVVFFRRIDDDNNLGNFVRVETALTHLGLLRIGSVWNKGVSRSVINYEAKAFDLSFSEGSWKIVSPYEVTHEERRSSLILPDDYPLRFTSDKNHLLDFRLPDDRNLLIPCTEFFVRCYGRSVEIKRVLATYPWHEAEPRLFKPIEMAVQPGTWPIKLARRIYNDDAVFIAHVMYDPYVKRQAMLVYSQIESAFAAQKPYAFLKIAPWFRGPAKIMVAGIPINGGRTFLGLQVLGGSQPRGNDILRDREWTNKTDGEAATDTGVDDAVCIPIRLMHRLPNIINLTSDDEPDHGSSSLEIEEDDYVILGEPRVVIDVRRAKEGGATSRYLSGDGSTSYSTGEPYGSEKDVGHASIHARAVMESHGILRDMWNAVRHLQASHPDVIQVAEWFTFEDGFQSGPDLKLVALEAFGEEEEGIGNDIRNWVFHDPLSRTPRGALIIRITMSGKQVYLLEIQRRPMKKKDELGMEKDAEEAFKGLVFSLSDVDGLHSWLRSLLAQVRKVKGVVQRLTGGCPGVAHAFKHALASDEQVPCEAAVKNALRKVGVEL